MRTKISNALFTVGMCLTVAAAATLLVVTQPITIPLFYLTRTLVVGMIAVALSVKMVMNERSR